MKVIKFGKKYSFKKPVFLLGAFETFHKGHFELLKFAKSLPHNEIVIFIFDDYSKLMKSKPDFQKFNSLNNNLQVLSNLNIDYAILATFNDQFKNMEYFDFINKLVKMYNVNSIVVGNDFKFGFNQLGNVLKLKEIFSQTHSLDTYKINNKKVSSRLIKELIEFGEISLANSLLMENWRITVLCGSDLLTITTFKDQLLPQPGIYIIRLIYNKFAYPAYLHINLANKLVITIIDSNIRIQNQQVEIEWLTKYRSIIKESQDGILNHEKEKIKIYFLKMNNKI